MASLSVYSAAVAAAGDNTLINAPGAGLRLVPTLIVLQNATATADTLLLYSGPSATGTKLASVLVQNQGDGLVVSTSVQGDDFKMHQLKLGANEALVLNKAQAVSTLATVWYYTEAA